MQRWMAFVVVTVMVGVGAQSATAASWSVQPATPPQLLNGTLRGVSCPSASYCIAVGSVIAKGGAQVTLAEVWNGSSWSIQSTPNPSGGKYVQLSDVSCTSPTACMAVGDYSSAGADLTLAESWDGTRWTIHGPVNPPKLGGGTDGDALFGVSCTSAIACVAVGIANDATLAEVWNGTSWATQNTPNPNWLYAARSFLNSVSCTSSTACTAVGAYQPGGYTVAERWDGSSWSVQSTPNPGSDDGLNGVSCTSDTSCVAVGGQNYGSSSGGAALVEYWDGSTWAVQSAPSPTGATSANLYSVWCANASACTAVGAFSNNCCNSLSVAEHWNGSTWAVQRTPNPDGSNGGSLLAVSCLTATACTAVGSYGWGAMSRTLAVGWSGGGWTRQNSANGSGGAASFLTAVSCASAATCVSTGAYTDVNGHQAAFADDWNGTTWSVQAVPVPAGARSSELDGVSCLSASACVAVGHFVNSAGTQMTLIDAFNGTTWSVQSSASPGTTKSVLSGVSCTSSTACQAVGYYDDSAGDQVTLAEAWDGTTWTVESTPNPSGNVMNWLTGVSCTSPTACTAVGYGHQTYSGATIAERWDGVSWTIEPTPAPADYETLTGDSCASATACVAVGNATGGPPPTFGDSWDGTSWTLSAAQSPSAYDQLSGVSCPSANTCTAVGQFGDAPTVESTLAEGWDGSSWTVQPSPNEPDVPNSELSGVSCSSATSCIAVGRSLSMFNVPEMLVEHYS